MKQLLIIFCLAALGACSSSPSGPKPTQKDVKPAAPKKNNNKKESPGTKDVKDTDSDSDVPGPNDDAGPGDGGHGGGCCAANFDQLGFQAELFGFEQPFTVQNLDTATMQLSMEAIDVIEGLDLMVLAEMKNEDHGTFMFGTEFKDEMTVEIQDISFLKAGQWVVSFKFYDDGALVDQSSLEVDVVQKNL